MDRDLNKIWNGVLSAVRMGMSEGTYTAYLKPTELVGINEVGDRWVCEIGCSSAFVKDTLEKRFWGQLNEELNRVTGKKCEIKLSTSVIKKNTSETEDRKGLPLFDTKNLQPDGWKRAKLRVEFTFDTYAVGGSNQMAFAAAQAVARKPGQAYNPLFIYGRVGVGKTHLMQAIGNELVAKGEMQVLFCSGEEFTNDLVEAIRFKNTEKVRSKYRKLKLLMIDDIQFIAGKPSVQEEFFHTFNTIQREGGQVVMTSDKPPAEISKLEERLRSRFGAGLIVDVGQPDFELRTAILLIKSKQKGIELEMAIAQAIAANIEGIRELQGFLSKLLTDSEMSHQPVSLARVEELLKIDKPSSNGTRVVTPSDVMTGIGNFYGVAVQQLKSDKRMRTIAWPRQILMYMLVRELKLPLEEVGRLVGGRDHTTVIHARDKVINELESNQKFKNEFGEVRRRIFS